MSMTRRAKSVVLGLAVLAVGLAPAMAAPQLLFHWDRESGTSQAVVQNSDEDVLAEFPWGGALPRSYSGDEDETEVPVFLLAKLRDQLEPSSQPEADDALDFIRDLMGSYADTPVEELTPSLGSWIPYASVDVEEWCGTIVNSYGECTEPGDPSFRNALCQGFVCKRTRLKPQE
jgi:hypothetical protein